MEFLKGIYGDKALTFDEFVQAIHAHNGNEVNKDNQIKIGNLGTGEYVSKAKHDALQELLTGKETELTSANELIAELKKGTKSNEDLQGKITGYETQVADLQKQLEENKIKAALKVALLSEKATDIDYLTYKLQEKLNSEGKTLELDDNEKIKGWDDILSGLKTQLPNQFESVVNKKIDPNRLPKPEDKEVMTKEDFNKLGYNSRVKLREENPELYETLTKG